MTVWLGVYIGSDETVNEQQKTVTLDVLRKYGVDHVSGVTVGNEFLLNAVNKANAAQALVSHVADVGRSCSVCVISLTPPSSSKPDSPLSTCPRRFQLVLPTLEVRSAPTWSPGSICEFFVLAAEVDR